MPAASPHVCARHEHLAYSKLFTSPNSPGKSPQTPNPKSWRAGAGCPQQSILPAPRATAAGLGSSTGGLGGQPPAGSGLLPGVPGGGLWVQPQELRPPPEPPSPHSLNFSSPQSRRKLSPR